MTRKAYGWTAALIGSIALNLMLFGLMPGLIQQLPAPPEELEQLRHVQVVRVKKDPSPPRRKKPVEKVKPKPLKAMRKSPEMVSKVVPVKPRLAFELNSKLPSAPMDLQMPPLETFDLKGPSLDGIYDPAALDVGLMALVKIPPIYPSRAKRRGIEGFVTVEFQVSKQGLVQQVKVVESRPETMFTKSVIACVSRWKFKPPTIEGIPVAARARTTIKFELAD